MEALTTDRWPGISFTDSGRQRFEEVVAFLSTLPESHPEVADEIREAFIDKLDYLNTYGGDPDDPSNKRFWVELHRDWAAHSFSVLWRRLGPEGPVAFNGGMIWHGGSNETFTVSLTPQWWGIHT